MGARGGVTDGVSTMPGRPLSRVRGAEPVEAGGPGTRNRGLRPAFTSERTGRQAATQRPGGHVGNLKGWLNGFAGHRVPLRCDCPWRVLGTPVSVTTPPPSPGLPQVTCGRAERLDGEWLEGPHSACVQPTEAPDRRGGGRSGSFQSMMSKKEN